jgi:hypothetical protein
VPGEHLRGSSVQRIHNEAAWHLVWRERFLAINLKTARTLRDGRSADGFSGDRCRAKAVLDFCLADVSERRELTRPAPLSAVE